jgi:hypothetical protein
MAVCDISDFLILPIFCNNICNAPISFRKNKVKIQKKKKMPWTLPAMVVGHRNFFIYFFYYYFLFFNVYFVSSKIMGVF